MPYVETGNNGPPFGAISVAGYIRTSGTTDVVFDYAGGALALNGQYVLPPMPAAIIKCSPISLWNASLEVHTGRIFEPILGNFYILVVPLVGLFTLLITVTGFFSWYLAGRKKSTLTMAGSRA